MRKFRFPISEYLLNEVQQFVSFTQPNQIAVLITDVGANLGDLASQFGCIGFELAHCMSDNSNRSHCPIDYVSNIKANFIAVID